MRVHGQEQFVGHPERLTGGAVNDTRVNNKTNEGKEIDYRDTKGARGSSW